MQEIISESHILSRKASNINIESGIKNEFGWGKQTVENCSIYFNGKVFSSSIYASENEILIIIYPKKDSSNSYLENRNEKKFIVEYENITGVTPVKYSEETFYENENKKEPINFFEFSIFTKFHQELRIKTKESGFLMKYILRTWKNDIIRRSALTGILLGNQDSDLAFQYYKETIKSILHSSSEEEIIGILHEFSTEILLDLELKDIVFKSRELILLFIGMIKELLFRKPKFHLSYEMSKNNSIEEFPLKQFLSLKRGLSNENDQKNSIDNQILDERVNEEVDDGTFEKTLIVILRRLILISNILMGLKSILFCSESVSSRYSILVGPEPFTLEGLCEVFVPNLFEVMCKNLQCQDTSGENDRFVHMDSFHPNNDLIIDQMSNSSSYSLLPAYTTGKTDSSLSQSVNKSDSLSKSSHLIKESLKYLEPAVQVATDMQALVLNEVFELFNLGMSYLNKNESSQQFVYSSDSDIEMKNIKKSDIAGNIYTKQSQWQISLENLVNRISAILDNILGNKNVKIPVNTPVNKNKTLNPSPDYGLGLSLPSSPLPKKNYNSQKFNFDFVSEEEEEDEDEEEEGDAKIGKDAQDQFLPKKLFNDDFEDTLHQISDISPMQFNLYNYLNMNSFKIYTQEIVLSELLSLIHYLSLDSFKIRDVLSKEFGAQLLSFIGIFNSLCPRPALSDSLNEESFPLNQNTQSFEYEKLKNITPKDTDIKKSNFVNKFRALFSNQDRSKNDIKTKNISSSFQKVELLISDFGPPKFGLSYPSWVLLILSRISTEKIITLLGLDTKNFFL